MMMVVTSCHVATSGHAACSRIWRLRNSAPLGYYSAACESLSIRKKKKMGHHAMGRTSGRDAKVQGYLADKKRPPPLDHHRAYCKILGGDGFLWARYLCGGRVAPLQSFGGLGKVASGLGW